MLGTMSATDRPDRQFGWWDMFVHPDDDPREQGGEIGDGSMADGYRPPESSRFSVADGGAGSGSVRPSSGSSVERMSAVGRPPG